MRVAPEGRRLAQGKKKRGEQRGRKRKTSRGGLFVREKNRQDHPKHQKGRVAYFRREEKSFALPKRSSSLLAGKRDRKKKNVRFGGGGKCSPAKKGRKGSVPKGVRNEGTKALQSKPKGWNKKKKRKALPNFHNQDRQRGKKKKG